jgi:hypothetical protein
MPAPEVEGVAPPTPMVVVTIGVVKVGLAIVVARVAAPVIVPLPSITIVIKPPILNPKAL